MEEKWSRLKKSRALRAVVELSNASLSSLPWAGNRTGCREIRGCFCPGRGLFVHCWDEKNPICFEAGCCLCSEPRARPWGEQALSIPSCQGTLLFFPSLELKHGERQPNLLFQLHFSHFMLVCGMLSELLTSGAPAVPGP